MKRVVLGAAASIVIFFVAYCVVSIIFSEHPRINASEVQSITINTITFGADSNPGEIAEFMKIYNSASVFRKEADTTPAYVIAIKLKNGKKIDIEGTTQGFHYVNDGEKSYRISSIEITRFLKDVIK